MVYRRKRGIVKRRMSLNNTLILINVVVFVFFTFFLLFDGPITDVNNSLFRYVALNPELFVGGFVWTLLTSMFMHGGFLHLFVNMVSMFFVGDLVEKVIGRKRFLWFYLASGLIAGLFFVGLAYLGEYFPGGESIFGGVNSFAVGASGALFGLAGLLAVLIPRLKVLVMFVIPMPMWIGVLVLMFGLWAISISAGLPVGNTAHFGGLITGVVYGVYLRRKYSRKVRMLNKMIR